MRVYEVEETGRIKDYAVEEVRLSEFHFLHQDLGQFFPSALHSTFKPIDWVKEYIKLTESENFQSHLVACVEEFDSEEVNERRIFFVRPFVKWSETEYQD